MNTIHEFVMKLRGATAVLSGLGRHRRQRRLLDSGGLPAGRVRRVLHDACDRILLIEVTARGVVGLRRARRLVPGELVTDVTDDAIHVALSREQLRRAPALREALPGTCLDEVYAYFGSSRPPRLRVYPGSSYSR